MNGGNRPSGRPRPHQPVENDPGDDVKPIGLEAAAHFTRLVPLYKDDAQRDAISVFYACTCLGITDTAAELDHIKGLGLRLRRLHGEVGPTTPHLRCNDVVLWLLTVEPSRVRPALVEDLLAFRNAILENLGPDPASTHGGGRRAER